MTARSIILGCHFGLLVLHFRTSCLRWIVHRIALRWNTIDYFCRQSVLLNMHWSFFDTHESELTLWIGAPRVYQYKHVSRVYVVVLRFVSTCNFVIISPECRWYVRRKCIGRAHRAVRKSDAAQTMVANFEIWYHYQCMEDKFLRGANRVWNACKIFCFQAAKRNACKIFFSMYQLYTTGHISAEKVSGSQLMYGHLRWREQLM